MPSPPVLAVRSLNRALLARQHLLERVEMPPLAMVEHLVAVQAQNPHDPYLALWARLASFDPAELSEAIETGAAVRMGSLRTTLHLLTARDAAGSWPVIRPVLARTFGGTPFARALAGLPPDEVAAAAQPYLAEPRSSREIGATLAARWPGRPPGPLFQVVRYHLPVVQVPPRGLWNRTGQPRWQDLPSWSAEARASTSMVTARALVIRYLAAFGPATPADVRTWSGLAGIREVLEELRPRLRTFRDDAGRELFDVPHAPLPHPDTPAPVRLLPEFDNVALSHADRSRIIAPASVGRLTGFVGTFLADGFVGGQWRLDVARETATLVLEPFVTLTDDLLAAIAVEARSLAALMARGATRTEVVVGIAREPVINREPG